MSILRSVLFQRRWGNALGFLACAALIAYALYSQHVLGDEPCPLCIFQRVAVMAVGVLFLLAALHDPAAIGVKVYGALLVLAAAIGGAISIRHIWIQSQPADAVAACGATLDYMLDMLPVTQVITKVLTGSGECHAINWTLLGLSMPWWVLFSLIALAGWAVWVNFISARRA